MGMPNCVTGGGGGPPSLPDIDGGVPDFVNTVVSACFLRPTRLRKLSQLGF
jgi:hypothetical protein